MDTLGDALPREINRVRGIQDEFKALRGMRNVIVEPQIAMMEHQIQAAIKALSEGDIVGMISAHESLKEWSL